MQSHRDNIYRITTGTLIAYRTGEEGWYRSFNETDPVVIKAKGMVKENLLSALARD